MGHHEHRPDPFGDLAGVDEASARAYRAWRTADRLSRTLLHRTLAERGAHPGQAMCLAILSSRDGISQRELAEALRLAPPTVTAMVQKLERAGLLRRRDDAQDQRLTLLTLTPEGRAMADDMRAVHARFVTETVGALPESDRAEFARILEALSERMHAAVAAGCRHDAPPAFRSEEGE